MCELRKHTHHYSYVRGYHPQWHLKVTTTLWTQSSCLLPGSLSKSSIFLDVAFKMSASKPTRHRPSKNFTLKTSDKRKKQQTRERNHR